MQSMKRSSSLPNNAPSPGQRFERFYVGAPGPVASESDNRIPTFVLYAGLGAIGLTALLLLVLSLFERHTAYIRAHPWRFLIELLSMSVICSLPIFIAAFLRGSPQSRAFRDFYILAIKFGLLWILFELTGTNELVFARTI